MIKKEILELVIKKPDWVEVLESIVKKEKLNPEDINIRELVNYYLNYIKSMKERDLKIPGNLILAASILLRIKAYRISFEEKDEEKMLEYEIKELKEPLLKIRKRKVTLKEIIETVKDIIQKEEKIKLEKIKTKNEPIFDYSDSFEDNFVFNITEIVDQKEDFELFVNDIFEMIKSKKDSENVVLFSQIVKENKEPLYICKVFLAVLHLANKGLIVLWQENFFGEIIIKVIE